ncbi:lysine transporter LysE [Candidatus Entotheonella serta]|nr:lysine transporter LysE [Candidatus Entotheonella serta]
MTVEQIVALVIFLFPLAYSPGPGNLFFAANGARFGVRSIMTSAIGYHVATWMVNLLIGLGFAAALQQFPLLFAVFKIAGSIYVLWLAWKLFRAGVLDTTQEAKPVNFWDGVVLMVLNPKAYIVIAVMFSQFLGSSPGNQVLAVCRIATIFTLNNLIAVTLWAAVGDTIARSFRSESNARLLNAVFGITLAGVAMWMLLR